MYRNLLSCVLLPGVASYYVGHVLVFVYGWLKQSNDERLAGLNTLKFSVWISRGAGLALGIDGLLLTLPGKPPNTHVLDRPKLPALNLTPAIRTEPRVGLARNKVLLAEWRFRACWCSVAKPCAGYPAWVGVGVPD